MGVIFGDILCFLHVLKVPDSKKVVFEGWSVRPSVRPFVRPSVNSLQPKRKEILTSNLVYKLVVPMGRDTKLFENIAHAQRVAAIELFIFNDIKRKRL